MPITEQRKNKFHPTERNKVLATADVRLQQVQVVDKKGQIRSVIVWQCGTDILYASTMDGLFDAAQRKSAPQWLIDALHTLPSSKQYAADGSAKGASAPIADYLPEDDGDAPDFVQG